MQRTRKPYYPFCRQPHPLPSLNISLRKNANLGNEFSLVARRSTTQANAASSVALRPGPQRVRITVAPVCCLKDSGLAPGGVAVTVAILAQGKTRVAVTQTFVQLYLFKTIRASSVSNWALWWRPATRVGVVYWNAGHCNTSCHQSQAYSLQGFQCVNVEALAGYDLAIAQAGNRSKQIWALPAMIGTWIRMACSDPCKRTTGVHRLGRMQNAAVLLEWFA